MSRLTHRTEVDQAALCGDADRRLLPQPSHEKALVQPINEIAQGEATVRLAITKEPLQAAITFVDHGARFDPLAGDAPDISLPAADREEGGLGIIMTITKNQNGTSLTIALGGRLDTLTAPELENEVTNGLDGITDLTLDLGELEYISSAGLRVLLHAHKAMLKAGGMRVIHVGDIVSEVFDVTGFSDILTIE